MQLKRTNLNDKITDTIDDFNDNWEVIEEEVSKKVDGLLIKNEIVNGDFSDGLTNWANPGGYVSLENGKARFDSTGESIPVLQQVAINANLINLTDVYYVSLISENEYVGRINLPAYYHTVIEPAINDKKGVNGVTFKYSRLAKFSIVLTTAYNSNILLDNVGVLNLTQTFGAGNEPTKEEMDALIEITGYINGEYILSNIELVNWLLSLIRNNTLRKKTKASD